MSRQSNVSLNTSEVLMPSAYRVSEIILKNYLGKEYNIQRVVGDFTITESIYRSALTLSLSIRDDSSFMEQAALSGHETIQVKLERLLPNGELQKVDLSFRVTEYPVYSKFNNGVQVYRLNGVAPHSYISKFKKISRSFRGKIGDFVKGVLKNDLGLPDNKIDISPKATGNVVFVVPNMEPIDAMHWAIRRAFTEENSPFYLYQTLDGVVHLRSQAEFAVQDVYKKYQDAKFFEYDIATNPVEAFEERSTRILSIDSDLSMAKPVMASNGAFSSRTEYVDLATKVYSVSKFNYSDRVKDFPTMEGYPLLYDRFEIDEGNKIGSYDGAKINYVPLNSLAYGSPYANYHSTSAGGVINQAQSQYETIDAIQHLIVLNGDFNLNCGKTIELKIPPAWDPTPEKRGTRGQDDETLNDYISGSYLVSAIVHNFAEEYYSEVKVKRDSTPTNPFTS